MSHALNFGAAGDGQTDDTEALQHAIDDGDGVLELAKGTYRITRPLTLDLTRKGPLGIRGDSGTPRLIMAGAGPAILLVGSHQGTADPESVKEPVWSRERFPTVQGLEIVGEHPEADGIRLDHTMMATVSGVLIRRCRHGVHLVNRNRNFLLANSQVYDNSRHGVFLDRVNLHQINLVGNHISYNKKAGVRSLDGDVHNLQISGNDIEYNFDPMIEDSAEILFEARDGIISEVAITGNTIQAKPSPKGANIRVVGAPGETLTNARILVISGNVIGSQTINLHLEHAQRVVVTGNSIYDGHELSVLAKSCDGLTLSGNTYGWAYRPERGVIDGIRLEDCEVGSISGQTFRNCLAGGENEGGTISLVRCRDLAVTDCQIRDPAHRGVWLLDCRRCRVCGNTVSEERSERRMRLAIELAGDCRDNLVQGNIVTKGLHGDIQGNDRSGRIEGNLTAAS